MKKKTSLLIALLLLVACTRKAELPDEREIVSQIRKQRLQKDASFKTDDSPIPDEQKASFVGLRYFPIDLKYRYQLRLHKYRQQDVFDITTSSGVLRKAAKYGYFEFEIQGRNSRLQVYKLLDIQENHPNLLFVPFKDATSGKETYGGGRYLDFHKNSSDTYLLDFNLAYNPSCAYGKDGYNCPIPPAENVLEVAILSGEKDYHAKKL